jgi:hypothetical protein
MSCHVPDCGGSGIEIRGDMIRVMGVYAMLCGDRHGVSLGLGACRMRRRRDICRVGRGRVEGRLDERTWS